MRALVLVQKGRWLKWHEHHRMEATNEFSKLQANKLFITGLMLYWGEGDNKLSSPNTRLSNTDPRMIKIFIDFAIRICKVRKEQIRLGLILYPDLNNNFCLNFWSNFTDIPLNQFHKTQYIRGKHPTTSLQYGICMVRIGGAGLKDKIITWLDLYSKSMMRA